MVKIGMMSFAHMHAGSYANSVNQIANAELVGVADHDPARGAKMAERFNTRYFPSYEALLAEPIDAVIVCPENIRHRELVCMAAAAGKHVLCEKPLATSIADARAMIEACGTAGVRLAAAFPCRYSPAMQKVKSAIDEGQIGKILAIRGTNRGRCPGGWFVEKDKSGGGAVIDHTVHVTDLMRWVTGAEPKRVFAEIGNQMFHKEYDDIGLVSINFDNGVFASLDSSWSRPKTYPMWGDVTMEIIGEEGTISMDMFSQNLVHYDDKRGGVFWNHWGSSVDLGLVQGFVDAIEQNAPTPITGEDGLAAIQVALAAYESARQGQPVDLPLLSGIGD